MKKIVEDLNYISKKMNDDNIGEYAAECAYFTILSFIPFIIFFITLIQFTSVDKETVFYCVREVVPTTMEDMIVGVIDEVYAKSFGTISVAAIFALWSASKGFYYLSKGLRRIYNTEKRKTTVIVRLEGLLYTLLFVIAIIAFLVIMVLGKRIHNVAVAKFETLSMITGIILKIRSGLLIGIMFFVCLIIYKFIPNHKMKANTQILGAAFSSISWYVVSWGFSVYIDVFKGFSNTYGSLTSIILIMMWVYFCMYIILLGAEINTIFEKKNLLKHLN